MIGSLDLYKTDHRKDAMEPMKVVEGDAVSLRRSALRRRDVMKIGTCAGAALVLGEILNSPDALGQNSAQPFADTPPPPHRAGYPTGAGQQQAWIARDDNARVSASGYRNESNRSSGNGPIDNMTRQIVTYVSSYSESALTDSVVEALNDVMVDTIGSLIAGFESEPARISARVARQNHSELKSTVYGYGVTTTPELAAFANCSMLRHHDISDNGWIRAHGHFSDAIGGVLAVAEALHSSGPQTLAAVTLAYELMGALTEDSRNTFSRGWDTIFVGPSVAMAAGKLLGLNQDQLANALSLSLVPHLPMGCAHADGPLSMWKACHNAEAARSAIFSSLMAREGFTGPCAPFEGVKGLWDCVTGPFKLSLPASEDGQMVVQGMVFKRFPAEGGIQTTLEVLIPQVRQWTKVDEIASMQLEVSNFGEICDPPKWDPRNEETADHSFPYIIARSLLDGHLFLDSYTHEKITDPVVRELMAKITIWENPDVHPGPRLTVRKKSGDVFVKEAPEDYQNERKRMSHDEVIEKFNQVCAYKSVTDGQRDRIRSTWSNLRSVKDISEAVETVRTFGAPKPL
jgi:2-methylcitrate dehydratase